MQQKQKPVDAARLQRQVHQGMVEEMAYRTGPCCSPLSSYLVLR